MANGYHSLFIKLFGHVQGAVFFRTRCSSVRKAAR